jgi:hypothetical protein
MMGEGLSYLPCDRTSFQLFGWMMEDGGRTGGGREEGTR